MMLKDTNHYHDDNDVIDTVENEIDEEEILNLQSIISEFSSSDSLERHMIAYTASVLQNDIIQGKWYWHMKCQECMRAFSENELVDDDLIILKMKSSKLRPVARSTLEICVATEKLMEKFEYEPKNYEKIPIEVLRIINFDGLFCDTDFDAHSGMDHKKIVVNLIIKMYIKKRQLFISRCNTLALHKVLVRKQLNKIVHFQGQ